MDKESGIHSHFSSPCRSFSTFLLALDFAFHNLGVYEKAIPIGLQESVHLSGLSVQKSKFEIIAVPIVEPRPPEFWKLVV